MYAAESITDLLHSQSITCFMEISEFKYKRAYLEVVNFKTKIEALGNTFNLHSNSTNTQEVWTLNWLQRKNLRVTYTHIHHFTMMFLMHKILHVFPFVSNQLSNWADLLGLSKWV